MLAHAPGVAYTTFLALFGCLGFLPVAMLRAYMGAPALGVNLGYGFTAVNAQFSWSGVGVLWTEVGRLYLPCPARKVSQTLNTALSCIGSFLAL